MADEAVKITLLGNAGDPVEWTVAAGTAIPKGTLMALSASPQVAIATSGATNVFAGITSVEKTATDGVTELALWTHGLFEMTCGAAESMVLGAPVRTGAVANEVTVAAGTAIPKGSLMRLSSTPQTALITSGENLAFVGIASVEKTATDGVTKLALWTHGIFDMTCGAAEAMVLGAPVQAGAVANEVNVMTLDTIINATKCIGVAQETVAGNGTGAVLINVGRTR